MKVTLAVFALCAVVALVDASPLPQEEVNASPSAPNRPILNAISSAANSANQAFGDLTNTGFTAAKRAAQTAGKFIDNTAHSMSNGINTVAHSLSEGINRPFQNSE